MLEISSEVKKNLPDVFLGLAKIEGLEIPRKTPPDLKREKRAVLKKIRTEYTSTEILKGNEKVRAYKDLFRRLGLDPTKQPPPAEYLISRYITKSFFPSINPVVDSCNLASVASLIPMSIFDADKISGDVILRYSKEGETFLPIGKMISEKVEEGTLILADSENVLSIFYLKDPEHQKVLPSTKNVILLACGAKGISKEEVEASLDTFIKLATASSGGECTVKEIFE